MKLYVCLIDLISFKVAHIYIRTIYAMINYGLLTVLKSLTITFKICADIKLYWTAKKFMLHLTLTCKLSLITIMIFILVDILIKLHFDTDMLV